MALQYSEDQLNEINLGKKQGVDTSVYENSALLAMQMQEIRIGLAKGLDARIYADPGFDWLQMGQIRKGLESGVDVKKYADKSIPSDIMREERKALEEKIDISDYKGNKRGIKSAAIMRQLRRGRRSGVDIMPFIAGGYDSEQLEEIRVALERGIDIVPYLNLDYRGSAIDEIRQGLEDMIDVSAYADAGYNWKQMHEIRLGITHRVDVTKYSNKLYSAQQMREIRLGLEAGLNVDEYRQMRFSATDMRRKRLALLEIIENATKAGEAALESVEELLQKQEDINAGREPITLSISSDKMEAYVYIREGYEDLTENDVLKVVWDGMIRKGIQRDNMKAVENGTLPKDRKILVAKGENAVNGEDGWYEDFFRTDLDGKPKVMEDGSVDHNHVEWFDTISKDTKIAEYHPATRGRDGFTVFGDVLPGRNGKEKPLLKGKGFSVSADKLTYTSTEDGMIVLKDDEYVNISNVLEVDEVNIATGFISFKGNVHVKGDVGVGGIINSGGDVIIDGFVEGGNITAEGNVLLRRGMNGGGRGVIHAGGSVTGKFFENTDVYAGKNVTMDYATNCSIYAENNLEVVKTKGGIIGGTVTALLGMTIYNVGNQMGQKTRICAGVPKTMEAERKAIRERMAINREQLKVLRNAEAEFHTRYPLEVLATMEVFKKIEDAIYTKEIDIETSKQELDIFLERMKEYNQAKIRVKGQLYEGVDVEISGRHWLSYGMKDVTLKLVNDEKGEHILAYSDDY